MIFNFPWKSFEQKVNNFFGSHKFLMEQFLWKLQKLDTKSYKILINAHKFLNTPMQLNPKFLMPPAPNGGLRPSQVMYLHPRCGSLLGAPWGLTLLAGVWLLIMSDDEDALSGLDRGCAACGTTCGSFKSDLYNLCVILSLTDIHSSIILARLTSLFQKCLLFLGCYFI